mmetsp:Transcript_6779/g.11951  ORF Transcript_6779/g.11951 Transcript_6779/m.11951 type:complete len:212 (+) Transcript_6779:111-746(+)
MEVNEADMVHKQAARLFRVRRTLMKMLANRRYLISQVDLDLTFEQFTERFGYPVKKESMLVMAVKVDDPNDQMFVFFPEEDKLDVKSIAKYAEYMKAREVRRAILVVEKDISSYAKKALADAPPLYFIEVFKESELLVDITDHELVPKHEVLSQEEKDFLMQRYNLTDSQLPRMYTTDPITRYFGLVRGQVVKVIRSSETAGRYVTYRIVQ